jgi:hypothetical protein
MLKELAAAAALIVTPLILSGPSLAQSGTASAALSSATTTIGDLLDNPASRAVLEKHLPDVVNSDQIDMARGMTLRDIQQYSADVVTDAKLAAIDADLARLVAPR